MFNNFGVRRPVVIHATYTTAVVSLIPYTSAIKLNHHARKLYIAIYITYNSTRLRRDATYRIVLFILTSSLYTIKHSNVYKHGM